MPPAPVRRAAHHRRALLVAALTLLALLLMHEPVHAAPGQSLGIQTHVLWDGVDAAEVERQLDLAQRAGAQIIRVDVGWSSLEQDGKGSWSAWHLKRLDELVSNAQRHNLRLLLTLADSPCWASSAPASLKGGCEGAWWERDVERYAPSDPRDYGNALAFLIRRYGTRVAAWEVWNEPNSADFFKTDHPAADYAALVRAAYRSAKAADPRAKIVAGALMHADFDFTESLYREGIRGYFDAFSIHPYCEDRSPMDPWRDEWMNLSFIRGVPKIRAVMRSHGDSRPMWLTEFGWSTSTTRQSAAQYNGVDETTQARDVTEAVRQVSRWSYVQTAIYYNLVNTLDDRSSLYGNYGLVRRDGTIKPAFNAFRQAARGFGANPTTAPKPQPATSSQPTSAGSDLTSTRPLATARRVRRPLGSVAVRRIRGGLRISGASAPRARVRVALFRVHGGRAARRPTLRRVARTNTAGRFALVVRDRRLTRGSWRAAHRRLR